MTILKKHSFWLAPLIAIVACISYFTFFYQFPVFRDQPWLNLVASVIAVVLSVAGLVGMWKVSRTWGKIAHIGGLIVTLAFTGMLFVYIYYLSYQLPSGHADIKLPPGFSLQDANGTNVTVSNFAGKKLLVSFYRGYW